MVRSLSFLAFDVQVLDNVVILFGFFSRKLFVVLLGSSFFSFLRFILQIKDGRKPDACEYIVSLLYLNV